MKQGLGRILSWGTNASAAQTVAESNLDLEIQRGKNLKAQYDAVLAAKAAANAKGTDQVKPADLKTQFKKAASSEGKQYGGWYDNPATGRNQRYWGNGVWTDGEEPAYANVEDIANLVPTMPEISPFIFDIEQAERDALTELEPYYQELIAQANGDVELAKARLIEDYNTGVRQEKEDFNVITQRAQEDYAVGQRQREENVTTQTGRMARAYATSRQQAVEDYLSQSQEYARLEPEEKAKVLDTLNQQGLLRSSIRTQQEQNLTERQAARREAIQRAMERKDLMARTEQAQATQDMLQEMQRAGEQAATGLQRTTESAQQAMQRALGGYEQTLGRETQDIDIAYPRYMSQLEEEKKQRAGEMAVQEQSQAQDRWMQEQLQNMGSYTA
jgi:hypothetical protein